MPYAYLLDKIRNAAFSDEPFTHIEIDDFFSADDFARITAAPEIAIVDLKSDEELFDKLVSHGYKIIDFPGCILDKRRYLEWHRDRRSTSITNSACEGFGMTLRLMRTESAAVSEVNAFLNSSEFQATLADKFDIGMESVFYDAGIQKYLDGYEISPHADIRRKALTYMVNLNPNPDSEVEEHHTHYLKFKAGYAYVQSYWEGHPDQDRCWVPWNWCDTKKMQRANNSIVIFSPNNATMHGVKTQYDHLKSQRTQLYGNFWYHEKSTKSCPAWEDFVIHPGTQQAVPSLKDRIKSAVPVQVKDFIKARRGETDVIADRLSRR